MQAQRKDLGERLAEKADAVEAAEKELKQFQDEKADYSAQQRALSRENEELKVKFSKLLDQFQEYVNETERKVEDETNAQKEVQEKILVDLN
jgi:chromosome segregation ATPase